jgi:hypothetical protein
MYYIDFYDCNKEVSYLHKALQICVLHKLPKVIQNTSAYSGLVLESLF